MLKVSGFPLFITSLFSLPRMVIDGFHSLEFQSLSFLYEIHPILGLINAHERSEEESGEPFLSFVATQ